MSKKHLFFISFTTIITFSAIYAPQPILTVLAREFYVTADSISLLITITLIPLAVAPLFYGYILEKFSAKKLLIISISTLILTEFILASSKNFALILALRFVQGLSIPAILTSLMTYISILSKSDTVQKLMSFYIASTIMGGFLGRFISGFISTYFGWRYVFIYLGVSLIFSLIFILNLKEDKRISINKIKLDIFKKVLSNKKFLFYYIVIFSVFFVFASLLNALPFRLKEISSDFNEFKTGVMYSGYLLGVLTSLTSGKIIHFFNNKVKNALIAGAIAYMFSLIFFFLKIPYLIFAGMFIFCGGMFTIHSILSGYLNKLAKENKGVVNGLYVSFYYTGGSIGSFLPIIAYRHFGWYTFLVLLAIMILVAIKSIFLADR